MISQPWEIDEYLARGRQRLSRLNSARSRKRWPTRSPAPAPVGIRKLAREAQPAIAHAADAEMFERAIAGEALQPWELRRVEYLAVRATARAEEGGTVTRRKSEPRGGKIVVDYSVRGRVSGVRSEAVPAGGEGRRRLPERESRPNEADH